MQKISYVRRFTNHLTQIYDLGVRMRQANLTNPSVYLDKAEDPRMFHCAGDGGICSKKLSTKIRAERGMFVKARFRLSLKSFS